MSTRGLIATENGEGKIISNYVHFDNYVEGGTGETLVKHYTTKEQVTELMALGPLSSLGEKLSPDQNKEHTKYNTQYGVCVAYHRDYGEKYREPVVWDNADTMLKNASDRFWAEYCYLFKDGEWYFDTTYESKGWRLVKDELKRLETEGYDDED